MADYKRFKQRWEGKRVDFDHRYAFQCVDVVNQYLYEEHHISGVSGNAIDYWSHPSQALKDNLDQLQTTDTEPGDIVVLKTAGHDDLSGDGHIGIADHDDANSVWLLEQNANGTSNGLGKDAIGVWRPINKSRIAGVWRERQPAFVQNASFDPPKTIRINKPTHRWNVTIRDFEQMAAHPVTTIEAGQLFDVTMKVHHRDGYDYYLENGNNLGGFNVNDCDDYTPPPAPVAPPKPVFERLEREMNVQTKGEAPLWELGFTDYADADKNHKVAMLPAKTPFVAVGKATRVDLAERPVYYMSAESFGDADVSGNPAHNQGVNTVDLEPAPIVEVPAPVQAADVQPEVAPEVTAAVVDEPESEAQHVDVTVVPTAPDAWKKTFTSEGAGDYEAEADTIVHDLDGIVEDKQLTKGQPVKVAGTFTGPDFIKYRRTVKSVEQGNWRGIPIACLKDDDNIFTYIDTTIDDFKEGIGQINRRRKAVIAAAKIDMNSQWLRSRLKKKDKV